MSWVNDLASGLEIPVGAATLAAAMYAACSAAEKAARPEALKDIGRILKDPSWSRSARPSVIFQQVFNWMFGKRHLSCKCVSRSTHASILFMLTLAIFITTHDYLKSGLLDIDLPTLRAHQEFDLNFCMTAAAGLIPDYLALGKSRLLMWLTSLSGEGPTIALLVILNILFSGLISLAFIGFVFLWLTVGIEPLSDAFSKAPLAAAESLINYTAGFVGDYLSGRSSYSVFGILFFSTLFTSVWTILILLSMTVLKLIAPLQCFTAWLFDVDQHPVKAIGIVAGALVMLGSLVWTVMRAVI